MNGTALRILQVLLWLVCASHIIIGGGIMISPAFQEQMATAYGVAVNWTGELSYLARILGVFMLGLGVIGIAAAINPLRYRVLVYGFAGIMLVRVLQRFVHREDIRETFGLEGARLVVNGAFFLVIAVALVVLLQMAMPKSGTAASDN